MESNNTTKSALAMGRPEHYGDVRETLADLERLEPDQYLQLNPGHPAFFYAPADVWVRPASDFTDPDEVRARIGTRWARRRFADLFSVQTGERVAWSQSPDGYVAEQLEKLPPTQRENYFAQNVVTRVGGYLLVGRGAWDTVAERVLDGEPAFEFISSEEVRRRETSARSKFLPIAEKHKPEWAERHKRPGRGRVRGPVRRAEPRRRTRGMGHACAPIADGRVFARRRGPRVSPGRTERLRRKRPDRLEQRHPPHERGSAVEDRHRADPARRRLASRARKAGH